ncbi:glycoside hydrolase, partial [Candidatus Desantisbacteria bacterium]|nr:glycoside hydrolase [Candidatus Desantisbacteria bacterium]
TQDFLDLQVWFNIAWFDPQFQGRDSFLVNLIKKQRGFSEEDKQCLINKQREVISWILPEYKRMQDKGQIEVSVTPYYHPILPLLCNTELARQSDHGVTLPTKRFSAPEDARMQIKKAVDCYQHYLGCNPRGMWPSEGSVCNDIIPLVADNGINWLATDEWILYHTLGMDRYSAHLLYKPYNLNIKGQQVSVIFRDRALSDTIGFTYGKWNTYDAVSDFITRLHHIRDMLPKKRNHLVCIAMDGENAWEYYSKDGWEFLEYLYTCLSNDKTIRCVTISEYLKENPPQEILNDIHPGSWIDSNFRIWIGDQEENMAWDYLYEAREALVKFEKEHGPSDKTQTAWEYIYIAEGSDWFWWYGDKHYSPNANIFDSLFRGYLEGVYNILGLSIPEGIKKPIKR